MVNDMKKTKIKARQFTIESFSKMMMRAKPLNGEDFWVFTILRDDPFAPTWNERTVIMGRYEICVARCAEMMEGLFMIGESKLEVERFQGPAARHTLADGLRQERKYREERKAQPCN